MDLSAFNATRSIVVTAPPEVLYDFIADMPAMGEISPQCTGGEWESGPGGVGTVFIGANQAGDVQWQTRVQVVVADRPREFAWQSHGQIQWAAEPVSRWGYTFEPVDGGTRVEETWQVLRSYELLERLDAPIRDTIPAMMQQGMEETLRSLQARFES